MAERWILAPDSVLRYGGPMQWLHILVFCTVISVPVVGCRMHEPIPPSLMNYETYQSSPSISAEDIKGHIAYLASPELGGRLTASEGERLATSYAARRLESYGLKGAGPRGEFYQPFPFVSSVKLGVINSLAVFVAEGRRMIEGSLDKDFRPLPFSKNGEFKTAPIVFAGYGIDAPTQNPHKIKYDSYAHLDVRGKWVVVFRFLPQNASEELQSHLRPYSTLRYKSFLAAERGAAGIIFVTGPETPVREELVSLTLEGGSSRGSIAAISMSNSFAKDLFHLNDRDLSAIQKKLDSGKQEMGFELEKTTLAAKIDLNEEMGEGRNVLAKLPAREYAELKPVVLGAHIDHLGTGKNSHSLAKGDEKDLIHYGADDNASGVAVVLDVVERLAREKEFGTFKPKRDLIVGLWSGEELGLLGSGYYVSHLKGRPDVYLNLDMVGRLTQNLVVDGVGSAKGLSELVKKSNRTGLTLAIQDNAYLPTDSTSFYVSRVPVISFFTGAHPEYHTPGDTLNKINLEGATRIGELVYEVTRALLNSETDLSYVEQKGPANLFGMGVPLRAYLGTIPDYSSSGEGLKLSGVAVGGPADKAGIKGGDQVVGLNGKAIANVYDYTFAIEGLKIGQPTAVIVVRDGKRLNLLIIPQSRE